jgi:hypothetical protein
VRHCRSGFGDALAAHQNFSRLDDPASLNIQQARSMKNYGPRWSLRLRIGGTDNQTCENKSGYRGFHNVEMVPPSLRRRSASRIMPTIT